MLRLRGVGLGEMTVAGVLAAVGRGAAGVAATIGAGVAVATTVGAGVVITRGVAVALGSGVGVDVAAGRGSRRSGCNRRRSRGRARCWGRSCCRRSSRDGARGSCRGCCRCRSRDSAWRSCRGASGVAALRGVGVVTGATVEVGATVAVAVGCTGRCCWPALPPPVSHTSSKARQAAAWLRSSSWRARAPFPDCQLAPPHVRSRPGGSAPQLYPGVRTLARQKAAQSSR